MERCDSVFLIRTQLKWLTRAGSLTPGKRQALAIGIPCQVLRGEANRDQRLFDVAAPRRVYNERVSIALLYNERLHPFLARDLGNERDILRDQRQMLSI